MRALFPHRRAWLATFALVALAVAILFAMDRPPICTCGEIELWHVLVEAAWEVMENTPMVIDRYRAVTVSFGYSGDSIVNSTADIGWMIVGFLFAVRVPARVSVAVAIGFELLTLWIIRDNLTLNVIMLFWPVEAIRQWQGLG